MHGANTNQTSPAGEQDSPTPRGVTIGRQLLRELDPHERATVVEYLQRANSERLLSADKAYGLGATMAQGPVTMQPFGLASRPTERITLENIDDVMRYQPWSPDQQAAGAVVVEALLAAAKTLLRHVPDSPHRSRALRNLVDARMNANAAISFRGRF